MQTTKIHIAGCGDDELRAVLVRPETAGEERAGILLVHDDSGLDPLALDVARRFAAEGYVVLAPDLYSRAQPPEHPAGVGAELDDRQSGADLERALERLAAEPGVDPRRLAAVGFGAGGTLAFLLGCRSDRPAAVVACHGPVVRSELSAAHPVQPLEMALNLACPLLALFGREDPAIPPEHVKRLRTVLSQFARSFDIVSLPDAGRGFFDDRCVGHHEVAAQEAWERTLSFLREHLEPA